MVDDTFILVTNIEYIDKFKEYFNSKHQNINFTSEFECDGKLPFLDNLIDRKEGKFVKGLSVAIKDHLKINKCESDSNNFAVIGCESKRLLRELKECLFINQLKPNLNKQVKSAKLILF